jgi:hypothetical protein
MNDHVSPEVAAVDTVGGVLTDLVELAERLPVPPERAEATARILDRLSEEIREAAGMLRAAIRPRIDGSVPAGDERVNRARVLLAEHREPLTMTPGDLRSLLARYRQRVAELLDVVGG